MENKIRELAEKAIAGKWRAIGPKVFNREGFDAVLVCKMGGSSREDLLTAEFIALVNPETVISLLDENAKFRSALEEIADAHPSGPKSKIAREALAR